MFGRLEGCLVGDVGREVQSLAVRGVEGYLVGDGGREV